MNRLVTMAAVVVLLAVQCCAATIPTPEQRKGAAGIYCVPASVCVMLRALDKPQGAAWIRQYATVRGSHWHGGMSLQRLAEQLSDIGFDVASTFSGDAELLDRVDIAVIDWRGTRGGRHAVLFCGYVNGVAIVSDSNSSKLGSYSRAAFLAYWKRCGGRAVAITGRK
jgi:hypothetical protein